jgi:hypothetical protein
MSQTLEFESLTQEQKKLVERLASAGEPTTVTVNGEPLVSLASTYLAQDEFEPLTPEEEAELIAIIDQADEDYKAGRLTPYEEILREWGMDEKIAPE